MGRGGGSRGTKFQRFAASKPRAEGNPYEEQDSADLEYEKQVQQDFSTINLDNMFSIKPTQE